VILNRYRITGELGRGGMGVVFRCLDETTNIHVAVKCLPPELSYNTEEMEEVLDNFRLVHRLHHPHIAALMTLDKDDATGEYFLVMECVDGITLRRWRKQGEGGRRSLEEVLPILDQVASALDYAHSERIVHRDVKPSNIMLTAAGKVKVLDFGLAAQIRTSLTRVSQVHYGTGGTAPYMAPEQWRGVSLGAATDQYALAVTAYELLAGRLPFENPDPVVLREAVLHEEPLALEDLPASAWAALARALRKEPEKRFASCAAFTAALAGREPVEGGGAGSRTKEKGVTRRVHGSGRARRVTGVENPCPKCGAENALTARFCRLCGADITRACPECGKRNSVNARYCSECGTDVDGYLEATESLERARSLAEEKRWTEALEEVHRVPDDLRLPGKKGRALRSDLASVGEEAQTTLERIQELRTRIDAAIAAEDFGGALETFPEYLELLPEDEAAKASALRRECAARLARSKYESLWSRVGDRSDVWGFSPWTGEFRRLRGKELRALVEKWGGAAWGRAKTAEAEGEKKAAAEDWSGAVKAYGEAREALRAALAVADLALLVDRAAKAADREKWEDVEKFLAPVVRSAGPAVVGGNAEYGELRRRVETFLREAERELTPRLKVIALLDGADVTDRASVAFDPTDRTDQSDRTDHVFPLTPGRTYTVTVTLPPRGKTHYLPFTKKITADWRGLRELRAELRGRKAGDVMVVDLGGGVKLELVWIPPGSFMMGSPKGEPGRDGDEGPQHRVRISHGFWMGKYEVTQRQWRAVMGNNPSHFKNAGPDAPVESVSWNDCQEFIKKLNARIPGGGFRLPTEAEWEYACRAGSTTALYNGPIRILGKNNAPALDPIAWYGGNSGVEYAGAWDSSDRPEKQYDHKRAGTHPVGRKAPNAWGLYDMLGNVWEWCSDWYGEYPSGPVTDPTGPRSGSLRVRRGGSWYDSAGGCRCANRVRYRPGFRRGNLGFRLVRTSSSLP